MQSSYGLLFCICTKNMLLSLGSFVVLKTTFLTSWYVPRACFQNATKAKHAPCCVANFCAHWTTPEKTMSTDGKSMKVRILNFFITYRKRNWGPRLLYLHHQYHHPRYQFAGVLRNQENYQVGCWLFQIEISYYFAVKMALQMRFRWMFWKCVSDDEDEALRISSGNEHWTCIKKFPVKLYG